MTIGHCRASTAAIGAPMAVASVAGLKRQRGSEDGVGDDPPARAAPALLLQADRHRGGAREHEDERERDEQGRRMQEHAQILGSGPPAHGALVGGCVRRARRKRDELAGAAIGARGRTRAARSSRCNSCPVHCSTMTRALLDSFWRAVAYCLHPRVIALSLLPLR